MTWRRLVRWPLLTGSRLFDAMSRALRHVAIGTLRLNDLRADIEHGWSVHAAGKPEEYVVSGFLALEAEAVAAHVRASDRVLIVGSGTGRDALAFGELGCRVAGVEPSASAIASAARRFAERGLDVPTVHGFFEDVTIDEHFDVISFSFFCYSYIPGSERRIGALRKAAGLLSPKGRILINVCTNSEPIRNRLIAVSRGVGAAVRTDWRMELGDEFTPTGDGRWRYVHIFRPDEFEGEAAAAGFEITFRNQDRSMFVLSVPGG